MIKWSRQYQLQKKFWGSGSSYNQFHFIFIVIGYVLLILSFSFVAKENDIFTRDQLYGFALRMCYEEGMWRERAIFLSCFQALILKGEWRDFL
jgi:hypothetical protein